MKIADFWLSFSGKFLISEAPDTDKYAVVAGEFEFGDINTNRIKAGRMTRFTKSLRCALLSCVIMANDHYVPELYLKNFAIPSKRKHVYRYKRGEETKPKAIRSVASKEDYELLVNENEHVKKGTVAAFINKVENDVSPLIQRLINEENPSLSTSERELMCSFVSYAVNRVPATRNQIINFFKAAQLIKAKLVAEDKEDFNERWKDSGLSPERIEEERLKILDFEKHYELEMAQGADISLVMSFLGAEVAKQFLKNKPIVFLNNKTRNEFVTSDNPVVCLPDETLPPQPGLGVANSIVYLPLSPRNGILFVNQKPPVNTLNVKRHEVDELNSAMINGADNCLFSSSFDQKIHEEFQSSVRSVEGIVVERGGKQFVKVG